MSHENTIKSFCSHCSYLSSLYSGGLSDKCLRSVFYLPPMATRIIRSHKG
ncbi:hypothetical protein HanRHA438_Chr15g0706151 [Helianthus annuus]|nr:hypothetical protein HanIR_Chr15g0754141 [Helianthus annuus]KAJ0844767.1 hypothetical protein HanRHA438_Chr15g0706151 [Helianthus annuus]